MSDRAAGPGPVEMPVFPLGSVLLPGQLLPLQVFEPRYKVMLFDLRQADPAEFAVVLIERGSEVGGGDVRSTRGCVARILQTRDTPDGRVLLAAVGTDRVDVEEWLDEDPYPRGLVTRLDDQPHSTGASGTGTAGNDAVDTATVEDVSALAREVGGLAERLGSTPWPDELDLDADADRRCWQLALLTPLGTLDRQQLLGIDGLGPRWDALGAMLEEQRELLAARLRWSDD